MSKNTVIISIIVILINSSCKSQQYNKEDTAKKKHIELGINDLALIPFPSDSTGLYIELGMPNGDYSFFHFKCIPQAYINAEAKIRGLFAEVKQSENMNTATVYKDSIKSVNFHSYAFEINKVDWDSIKNRASEIERTADTAYKNFYCEFCPSYSLGYNNKMIDDKLTETKKVKTLFDYLVSKYKNTLYASKK